MIECYVTDSGNTTPIVVLTAQELVSYLQDQPESRKNYIQVQGFEAKCGQTCLLHDDNGNLESVLFGVKDKSVMWPYGALPMQLPKGDYHLQNIEGDNPAIAWGLGAYQFSRYKKTDKQPARLSVSDLDYVTNMVESGYLVRDLINTPAEEMNPEQLAIVADGLAKEFGAKLNVIVGDDLVKKNYPAIYAVGRAGRQAPRLIDLRWGNGDYQLTLVGKGVCFDTGGLHLKPGKSMNLMKKDMGGSAHALGFARMIMQANLPVCLRVLIPAVENAIDANAYRPGDVVTMRNGKTVEITNTDAEGRMVLADALVEASSEKPNLLIDFATLTGAARVAVGTDIAAMFATDDDMANKVYQSSVEQQDPVWRLPLHPGYQSKMAGNITDLVNSDESGYAGAITAALFLQNFVDDEINWLHFDLMAYNLSSSPGRPRGGEMMCLRALYNAICGQL